MPSKKNTAQPSTRPNIQRAKHSEASLPGTPVRVTTGVCRDTAQAPDCFEDEEKSKDAMRYNQSDSSSVESEKEGDCICPVCEKIVTDEVPASEDEFAIFCDGCKQWLHRCCAGLPMEEFDREKRSNEPFYCPRCSPYIIGCCSHRRARGSCQAEVPRRISMSKARRSLDDDDEQLRKIRERSADDEQSQRTSKRRDRFAGHCFESSDDEQLQQVSRGRKRSADNEQARQTSKLSCGSSIDEQPQRIGKRSAAHYFESSDDEHSQQESKRKKRSPDNEQPQRMSKRSSGSSIDEQPQRTLKRKKRSAGHYLDDEQPQRVSKRSPDNEQPQRMSKRISGSSIDEQPQQMLKRRKLSAGQCFELLDDEQPQQVSTISADDEQAQQVSTISADDEQAQRMSKRSVDNEQLQKMSIRISGLSVDEQAQQPSERSVVHYSDDLLQQSETSADDKQRKQMLERKRSVPYILESTHDEQPQQMSKEKRKHPSIIPKTLEPVPQKASSSSLEVSYNLPAEILEIIFCLLPLPELYLSCRLVCKLWNDIIMRKKFIQWKKMYFQYKVGRPDVTSEVEKILKDEICKGVIILELGRYAREFFSTMEEQNRRILLDILKSHPRFSLAQTILEAFGRGVDTHLCEVIPLLVMCSRSVHHVHSLVSRIRTGLSPHGLIKTVELFYCLATLFFALWTKGLLSPRYHYFLFYSLNILERSELCQSTQALKTTNITPSGSHSYRSLSKKGPATRQLLLGTELISTDRSLSYRSPQQVLCCIKPKSKVDTSLSKTTPATQQLLRGNEPKSTDVLTHEQMRVASHSIRDGEVLKVVALAGTGKTTTLVKFSETFVKKNPNAKILYCVFNRSVRKYAKKLFPKAVDVRTFHSLAYVKLDVRKAFKNKLCQGMNVLDVAKNILGKKIESKYEDLRIYIRAKYILKTLQAFIASEDDTILAKHVPSLCDEDSKHVLQDLEKYRQELESKTADFWDMMCDPTKKSVKMTNDGYLKLFQLQKPVLNYDCILVDEAQDLTPAQISIVLQQKCGKVFVGDPHQQIYSFRLAVNAMESVKASTTLYLTQSFRFGPELALVASCVLSNLKHERKKTLVGSLQPGGVDGEEEGQVAIIARMNSTLFDNMVTVCTHLDESSKIIGFAGGLAGYGLDEIVDVYHLGTGKRDAINKGSFIKQFMSYKHLKAYARDAEDTGLWGKIKISEKYGQRAQQHVEMIKQHATQINRAKIIFSTAHKAKGLEFTTVKLCDDFLQPPKSPEVEPNTDEYNLLYVAVTRARKRLIMSPYLKKLLQKEKEEFIYPMSVSSPWEHHSIKCAVCGIEKPVPPLLFKKTAITLKREFSDTKLRSERKTFQLNPSVVTLMMTEGFS